jgi:RNA polymerase sigma factor (sigma-70 family)
MPSTGSHGSGNGTDRRPGTATGIPDLAWLRRRVLAAVRRSCPRWLAEQAEDITQEVMVRLVRVIEDERERNRELPASYLTRTAYNATIDAIRRNRQRHMSEKPMEETIAPDIAKSENGDPERRLAATEVGREIQDCLGRLVRSRRTAVVLYLNGHTVPEIGRLLGWPTTRANNLVYRALGDIRGCLEQKGITP